MAPVLSRSVASASVAPIPGLVSGKSKRVFLPSAFLPRNGLKNSFSRSGLGWKLDKRHSGVVVRCDASAVAEKEVTETDGEKHEYQAEVWICNCVIWFTYAQLRFLNVDFVMKDWIFIRLSDVNLEIMAIKIVFWVWLSIGLVYCSSWYLLLDTWLLLGESIVGFDSTQLVQPQRSFSQRACQVRTLHFTSLCLAWGAFLSVESLFMHY